MVKRILSRIMALWFLLCRLMPVQRRKVVLFSNFPVRGSLEALGDAMAAAGCHRLHRCRRVTPLLLYRMATAGAVFLNNNWTPLAYLPFSRHTALVQLWHGDGALKKWGYSLKGSELGKRIPYTAAVCSCEAVRPAWAEAFGLPIERVLPLGSARMDALLQANEKQAARAAFDQRYPACRGKRLILYAPTFREDSAQNAALLSHFDAAEFQARFGEQAALLIRLHPKMHGAYEFTGSCAIDVTGIPEPSALLPLCSWFITDYSSLCLDAAALDVPTAIYAYDEAEYMAKDHGMYIPLTALAPGPVAHSFPALMRILAAPDTHQAQRKAFAAFHLGTPDGRAAQRIMAWLEAFHREGRP